MGSTDKHFELAVALARDALKALLIVNGGAATALVALMDKSNGSKDYTCAIVLFAAGAVFAAVSACFGYISQLCYANHVADKSYPHRLHERWQTATIATVSITLISMVAGIIVAAFIARP